MLLLCSCRANCDSAIRDSILSILREQIMPFLLSDDVEVVYDRAASLALRRALQLVDHEYEF